MSLPVTLGFLAVYLAAVLLCLAALLFTPLGTSAGRSPTDWLQPRQRRCGRAGAVNR
jgi:hypothetical protein